MTRLLLLSLLVAGCRPQAPAQATTTAELKAVVQGACVAYLLDAKLPRDVDLDRVCLPPKVSP